MCEIFIDFGQIKVGIFKANKFNSDIFYLRVSVTIN